MVTIVLYYAYTYQESEGVYMTKVIRFDRNTLEAEELIADRSMNEPMRGFWVDPDGTMIFTPYGYKEDAKIFYAKDGKLELLAGLHDEDGRFSTASHLKACCEPEMPKKLRPAKERTRTEQIRNTLGGAGNWPRRAADNSYCIDKKVII